MIIENMLNQGKRARVCEVMKIFAYGYIVWPGNNNTVNKVYGFFKSMDFYKTLTATTIYMI